MPVAERAAAKNPPAPIRMSRYIVPLIHLARSGALSSFAIPRAAKNSQKAAKKAMNSPKRLCIRDKYTAANSECLGQLAKHRHSAHPMREDVKQKHFSTLSVRPRSVLASRPLLLSGEDFGFNAWSVTEYDRDRDCSCWSALSGFMQRSRHQSLRSCASQPLA